MVSYQNPHLYNGRYRALVIDDKDPLFRMRVKVRIPDLMIGEEQFVGQWKSNGIWAFPANNYLGGRSVQDTMVRMNAPDAYYQGSCLIPPKGSHVWIIFEKGDVSHPFYTGSAEYGDCVAPPENQIGKEYQKKWTLFKSAQGRCLIASDDDSDCRWEITGKKRKIKNPPFGDVDSVYKIEENQTVFLMDERKDHEKILLRDYTGNYMKLVQDELDNAGKFFMHTNSDMHLDCGGDFYLTVAGDIHIRADNIYLTAIDSIFEKAHRQLKQYTQTFDCHANTYYRMTSGNVDFSSTSSITMLAQTKIYQASLSNIRNCVGISDCAAGSINIVGGGYVSLAAAGKVLTHGKAGTSIQTPDPLFKALSNNTSYASFTQDAKLAKPDGERYQDIEYDREPILTLSTSKDSLKGFSIKHNPLSVSQSPNAGVGAMSNESASYSSNGGSGGSSGNSGSDGSSSGGSNNNGSNSDFDDLNWGEGNNNQSDSNNGTILEDITNDLEEETNNEIYSFVAADQQLDIVLVDFSDRLDDYIYSRIAGISGSVSFDFDFISYWEIRNKALVTNQKWWNDCIDDCYDKICNCLIYDVVYDEVKCNNTTSRIYSSISQDYDYLINQFINSIRELLNNNLPKSLSSYIPDQLSVYSFDCFENLIKTRRKQEDVSLVLQIYSKNFCSVIVLKAFNDILNIAYVDLQNTIDKILGTTKNIVDTDKVKYSSEFSALITSTIKNSTSNLKKRLIEATKIKIDEDKLISSESLDKCIKNIITECDKLSNKLSQSIEDLKNNSELIEELTNELIQKCKTILKESSLTEQEINAILNNLSSLFDKKVNDSLKNLDTFQVPDNIFWTSYEKINSEFENVSYNILKVYDDFKLNLVSKYNDRIYDAIKSDINPIISDIVSYSSSHPQETSDVISVLKSKIDNLIQTISVSISKDNLLKNALTSEEIDELLQDLKTKFQLVFVNNQNDTITQPINNDLNDVLVFIEKKRKNVVNNCIKVVDVKDNEFSKYNSISYETLPDDVGFGYKYLLFMNDNYRKTIAPLILKSGGNVLSFDIMVNTALIEEPVAFINKTATESYNKIFNNLETIDTTTQWWKNLKDISSQCSIYGIKMVINLCDFNDETNPFILNKDKKIVYTDKGWDDNVQGKFFKTVFDVISQYNGEVIYNLGRGSYTNPYDYDHKFYNMYPNCGYLRKLINYFVYNCGVTSNVLSLTANEEENLYYYNPYTEYHSYDDDNEHLLGEHDILISDCIDNKINDNADIVKYNDDGTINGYAGYLIKCNKESIAIFSMDNLNEHIPFGGDVYDCNIMNAVFCKNSREATRYFKTKDYFESTGSIEFDVNGEVK